MSKPKAVTQVIKLLIKAGQAKPGPPVGAALGQAGLKIIEFTKDFNAKTSEIDVRICICVSFVDAVGPACAGGPGCMAVDTSRFPSGADAKEGL